MIPRTAKTERREFYSSAANKLVENRARRFSLSRGSGNPGSCLLTRASGERSAEWVGERLRRTNFSGVIIPSYTTIKTSNRNGVFFSFEVI